MKIKALRMAKAFAVGATVIAASPAGADERYMPDGALTSQPVGHFDFCVANPDECGPNRGERKPVHLSRKLWARIVDVNNAVNVMVAPKTDWELWGREEVWSYPDREGDCEDYALEKRRQLMAAGVPASTLLMTVVRQRNGDGHAVLTVRTDMGDFVLDNLEPRVLAWNETEYRFLKRQSSKNAGEWVSVQGRPASIVGSVRN